MLFAFILCLLLLLINHIFFRPARLSLFTFVLIGVIAGLLPLARPFSTYFLLLLPIVILFAYLLFSGRTVKNTITLAKYLILSTAIATSVLLPWMIRNYQTFGTLSMTKEEGTMFEQQFEFLLTHSGVDRTKWEDLKRAAYRKHGEEDCFDDSSHLSCRDLKTKIFFHAIIDQPKTNIAKAFISSWTGLFLSGGTTSIVNYLGVQENTPFYFSGTYKWVESSKSYILALYNESKTYFLLFILCSGFAILTRIIGILGFFLSLRMRGLFPLTTVYFYTVISFVGLYLFMTTSRLRIPLEIILMLYSTVGITAVWQLIKTQWAQVRIR
jgi:hypothetical protein